MPLKQKPRRDPPRLQPTPRRTTLAHALTHSRTHDPRSCPRAAAPALPSERWPRKMRFALQMTKPLSSPKLCVIHTHPGWGLAGN